MTSSVRRKLWAQLGIPEDYARRAERHLQPEAKRLVFIGKARDDGKNLRLTPGAAKDWRRMKTAAAGDGITLLPLSAYRSVARQTAIIRRKLKSGQRIGEILRVSAVPGCSEHHTGRALDLGSPKEMRLTAAFGRTPEFRWLMRHALRFGFHLSYPRGNRQGLAYEPWHWCWKNT